MAALGLAVLVFGWAPPIWVGQCWWPLSWGNCRGSTVEGAEGWRASIILSVAFFPKKFARSVGIEGASPKSLARSNWTCFYTRPKGGHSATGLCREGGLPLVCIGAQPLCILLLWIPAASGEDEDHSRSSLATCLQDVSTEGLEMETSTYQVCLRKSQNVALGVRVSDTITTHSYKWCSCTWNGKVYPLIWIALSMSPLSPTWPPLLL